MPCQCAWSTFVCFQTLICPPRKRPNVYCGIKATLVRPRGNHGFKDGTSNVDFGLVRPMLLRGGYPFSKRVLTAVWGASDSWGPSKSQAHVFQTIPGMLRTEHLRRVSYLKPRDSHSDAREGAGASPMLLNGGCFVWNLPETPLPLFVEAFFGGSRGNGRARCLDPIQKVSPTFPPPQKQILSVPAEEPNRRRHLRGGHRAGGAVRATHGGMEEARLGARGDLLVTHVRVRRFFLHPGTLFGVV